jgi:hypothetical protein
MTTSLWEEFAWHQIDESGPQTERLGDGVRGSTSDDWGRSESLDPDNVGDIADEGAGHRG